MVAADAESLSRVEGGRELARVDVARAHVPANATLLKSSDFHTTLVWPEEPNAENEGAYVAVAPGGDTYVAWERNVDTNLFFGDPHIYEHVAFVPADANAPIKGKLRLVHKGVAVQQRDVELKADEHQSFHFDVDMNTPGFPAREPT